MLDAIRLREGLRALDGADRQRANRVRARATEYMKAISTAYPGDPATGILKQFENFPPAFDDVPCPALDPDTGCCDLYDSRPITCRTFGPAAAQADGSIGACELCYAGASDEEIAACVVEFDPNGLESDLLAALEADGICGETVVAYALALPW
jgi:Fe-S-cluster containining protein